MTTEIVQIPLPSIQRNPYQPRARFSEASLDELAQTIRQHGVLQPVLVRPEGPRYILVAGERRLRAAERAGLATIPAVVRDLDQREMLEMALVENLQREDINAVETARAFQRLSDEFGLTHSEIAQRTGKSRASVVNSLRLLQLPSDVLKEIEAGRLSEGHARALLHLATNRDRRELMEHILSNGLSVREAERAARKHTRISKGVSRETPLPTPAAEPVHAHLEERLRQRLGTRVRLQYRAGQGSIAVEFYSDEDLARILELLGVMDE
jgi:ParB family chromosome partitioning protein